MSRRADLRHPALRLGLSTPVVVLLAYALGTNGGIPRPGIAGGLLLVGTLLAFATLVMASRTPGVPLWWQVTATGIGVGLLPVLLVEGLQAPADTFSLLFVLVLVVGAFTYPDRARIPLFAWTLAAWFAALWWDGVREVDLLLLHLGAGALIAYTVMGTADALGRATDGEAAARQDAERRADLLARTLEVHTLDRDEVLQAVLDGLAAVGFAAASVRVPEGDHLVLAAGLGLHGPLEERIACDEGLPGVALRTGQIEVVADRARMDELGVEAEAVETIAVPIESDGHVEAVVSAITVEGPIRPQQREAIELLSALAGGALQRAEAFAADARTVAELRRLEVRTQDFVSTVSHELRTPLTVVQGLGRTLRTRWHDLDPERREDLLRRVDANAVRLGAMVRSMLDTSAFEEGRIALDLQPVALADFLAGLLHRLAEVTGAHPVSIDVPEGLRVLADRPLLEHVLENLVSNAAKHTPPGTRIHLEARVVDGGRVEVAVADDGPGIPARDLPHVRDRFYRGGDPLMRPVGGLGLGLALASQIVAAHDSQLTIESEEGQGSRFAFRLARAPD